MFKPTIKHIEYFLELSNTLSFSRAAENLFITQSALSNAIQDLESGLAISLFERSSRRVFLTSEGQTIKKKFQPLIQDYSKILHEIEGLSNTGLSNIRLGIIPTIAPYVLGDLLKKTKQQSPNTRLTITEGLTKVVLEQLDNNEIDIGLIALPYPLKSAYQTKVLFDDPLYLAISKEKSKNMPHTLDAESLKEQQLLLLEDGHCLRDQAIQSCQLSMNQIQTGFKGTSLATVLSLVAQGEGTSLVPEMFVLYNKDSELDVNFIPLSSPTPLRTIALVWTYPFSKNKAEFLAKIVTDILQ